MWRQEPEADRDYPVRSDMAEWLIRQLCDRDFDIAAMDGLEEGQFEGHAFSFIHRRYLQGIELPVIPVIINTFDPPNQPTPRRCIQLGRALRELIAAYPEDLRVGVLASGGLSHFVVDEELDHAIIDAVRLKDSAWLAGLDPKLLQAGSSEIRNWIVSIEAVRDLELDWVRYVPGYRTPALTGTGLCFAAWKTLP
jgi:3-O-methylgallate 3,4-dioxygenase